MEAVGNNPKKGFSLIEAAFVLAVVGGVIGAIWGASAKFYEDYKVSKTVEGVFTIAQNVQNLLSFRDAEAIGNAFNMSDILEDAGALPDGWRNAKVGYISNPLSLKADFYNTSGGQIINSLSWFQINLFGAIPESKCVKLVTRTSSIAAKPNGKLISVNNHPTGGGAQRTITVFPVSPTTASNFCAGGTLDFSFSFSYTRNN